MTLGNPKVGQKSNEKQQKILKLSMSQEKNY